MGTLDPEDDAIINVARDVFNRLGITGRTPSRIVWATEEYEPGQPAFGHGKLGLRRELKGKLSPNEWRPLMTSSLVLTTRLRRSRYMAGLVVLVGSLSVYSTLILFLFFRVFPLLPEAFFRGARSGAGLFTLFLFLGVVLFFARLTGPYRRKLRFVADQITSDEFGMGTELLSVLRKIDAFEIVRRGRYSNPFVRHATVAQRIQNLSK